MKISASFLSSKYKAKDLINKINNSKSDYLHVDIMDGKFVENKTFTYSEIAKLTQNTNKTLDIHLMVRDPLKYIEKFALLNAEFITFHYESVKEKDIENIIDIIHNFGIKAGMSIKPNTNVSVIFPYLVKLDLVLIMSVEPGKSGQKFMESVVYKLDALNTEIKEKKYKTLISIDGGINSETIEFVRDKVDIVTSASYLHEGDIDESIDILRGK